MEPYQDHHTSYVVWWTGSAKEVTWKEAFDRYDYYLKHGSTPYVFDLKCAYDDKGDPCMLKESKGK